MIDHKASTAEIEAAISRAETLLEDWLWAAAHVQQYDRLIKQANDVPKPDGPLSIAEWVAYQRRADETLAMESALWHEKEPHRLSEQDAYWGLIELLPGGQSFIIVAFGARYTVKVRRNEIVVCLTEA